MLEVRARPKQTYFNSAVWAAMRVRSDLSARGQPDRLEDQRKVRKRTSERKNRLRGGCLSERKRNTQEMVRYRDERRQKRVLKVIIGRMRSAPNNTSY